MHKRWKIEWNYVYSDHRKILNYSALMQIHFYQDACKPKNDISDNLGLSGLNLT